MRPVRSKEDARFWEVTKGLEWRLDDGSGGPPPPDDEVPFDRGGGGSVWPTWATHLMAFLFGALTFGWLLIAPPVAAVFAFAGIIGVVVLAVRHRWH